MTEYWKDIKDYEGLYQVSNYGRVKSLNWHRTGEERVLKGQKVGSGYLHIGLCKNGKKKHFKIHRLVAQAFIPNPDNLPEVNHKDENPSNNFVGTKENNFKDGNLEWCTAKYNINYGSRNERVVKKLTGVYNNKTKSKTVIQLRMDGSLVRIWPSVMEIQRQTGYSPGSISGCCRGERHSAYGFKWCYAF